MRVGLVSPPVIDFREGRLVPIAQDESRESRPYGIYLLAVILKQANNLVSIANLIARANSRYQRICCIVCGRTACRCTHYCFPLLARRASDYSTESRDAARRSLRRGRYPRLDVRHLPRREGLSGEVINPVLRDRVTNDVEARINILQSMDRIADR